MRCEPKQLMDAPLEAWNIVHPAHNFTGLELVGLGWLRHRCQRGTETPTVGRVNVHQSVYPNRSVHQRRPGLHFGCHEQRPSHLRAPAPKLRWKKQMTSTPDSIEHLSLLHHWARAAWCQEAVCRRQWPWSTVNREAVDAAGVTFLGLLRPQSCRCFNSDGCDDTSVCARRAMRRHQKWTWIMFLASASAPHP